MEHCSGFVHGLSSHEIHLDGEGTVRSLDLLVGTRYGDRPVEPGLVTCQVIQIQEGRARSFGCLHGHRFPVILITFLEVSLVVCRREECQRSIFRPALRDKEIGSPQCNSQGFLSSGRDLPCYQAFIADQGSNHLASA